MEEQLKEIRDLLIVIGWELIGIMVQLFFILSYMIIGLFKRK